jgi:hypothetical protein
MVVEDVQGEQADTNVVKDVSGTPTLSPVNRVI